MNILIAVSLILNVVVLVPVCAGLITQAPWTDGAYGSASSARGILLSVYLAILVTSVLLLIVGDPRMTAALLAVQVIYKLTTPLTVGTFDNPVVTSNLLIAAVHTVTLFVIWKTLA